MGIACSKPSRSSHPTEAEIHTVETALGEHTSIELLEQAIIIALSMEDYRLIAKLILHPIADGGLLYFALDKIQTTYDLESITELFKEISKQRHWPVPCNKNIEQLLAQCIMHTVEMNNEHILQFLLCTIGLALHEEIEKFLTQPLPEKFYNSPMIIATAKQKTCIPYLKNAALCAAIEAGNIEGANAITEHIEYERTPIYAITKVKYGQEIAYKSPLVLAKKYQHNELHDSLISRNHTSYIDLGKTLIESIENNYVEFVEYVTSNHGNATTLDTNDILWECHSVNGSKLGPIEYAIHLKNKEILRLLVKAYGVNRVGHVHATPIFYAIKTRNDDMLRFLIQECGADCVAPIIPYDQGNTRKMITPFMRAVELYNDTAMRIIASSNPGFRHQVEGRSALSYGLIELERLNMFTILYENYRLTPTPGDAGYLIKLAAWAVIHNKTDFALTISDMWALAAQQIIEVYEALRTYPITISFPLSYDSRELRSLEIQDGALSRLYKTKSDNDLRLARLHHYVISKPPTAALEAVRKKRDEIFQGAPQLNTYIATNGSHETVIIPEREVVGSGVEESKGGETWADRVDNVAVSTQQMR